VLYGYANAVATSRITPKVAKEAVVYEDLKIVTLGSYKEEAVLPIAAHYGGSDGALGQSDFSAWGR